MLPLLQLIPMLQRKITEEEVAFWHGLDLEIGEELELGIPPLYVQLEDMSQRVWWGPEPEAAVERPPLIPLREHGST